MDTQAYRYGFRDNLPAADPAEKRARRLAAHERRIHNHPCPCGSGKRYAGCCIGKNNQAQIELRHQRCLARAAAEAKGLL